MCDTNDVTDTETRRLQCTMQPNWPDGNGDCGLSLEKSHPNSEEELTGVEGRLFKSCDELKQFIKFKEETDYVQLYIQDSRTVEAARKRGIRRPLNTELKYYDVTYRCIHGSVRPSRSSGVRPNQSSFRQGCLFKLRLKASSDGLHLEVKEVNDIHNHEHSKSATISSGFSESALTSQPVKKNKKRQSFQPACPKKREEIEYIELPDQTDDNEPSPLADRCQEDSFGENVSQQLKELSRRQKIIAQKLISDVLYHAQLENLTEQSVVSPEPTN